jgi:hypothetical protein
VKILISAIVLILFPFPVNADPYLLKDEILIISFKTANGKKMSLTREKNYKYIVYRYGTNKKIELEYPEKTEDSWRKFKYSFYFRGGGKQNEGMDINKLTFINNNSKYEIYHDYTAGGEEYTLGIRVTDLKAGKSFILKGKEKTQNGSLIELRYDKYHELIEIDNDVF